MIRRCDIDQIKLIGLKATGFHGVFPEERRTGQSFVADVVLDLDLDTESDRLDHTVDYAELAAATEAILAGEPCHLIETVAGRIATHCLAHPQVTRATVTVHKPQAPLPHTFADVAVTISRSRS